LVLGSGAVDVDLRLILIPNLTGDVDADESVGQAARSVSHL